MKMNGMNKKFTLVVCIVLIAAMALMFTGCGTGNSGAAGGNAGTSDSDVTVLGEGKTVFNFIVVGLDGTETKFEIHTDETTVGAALQKLELIDGEVGEYGLYVDTVNGETVDWDRDGKYWGFYVDGEYAMTGVDSTEVTAGTTYTFKAE